MLFTALIKVFVQQCNECQQCRLMVLQCNAMSFDCAVMHCAMLLFVLYNVHFIVVPHDEEDGVTPVGKRQYNSIFNLFSKMKI